MTIRKLSNYGSISTNKTNYSSLLAGNNPAIIPGTPSIASAVDVGTSRAYNNGAATITITPSSQPLAFPVTTYTVKAYNSAGVYQNISATTSSTTVTITGLASSIQYKYTAYATNAVGDSAESSFSSLVTATTVPQAPTIGTAAAGEGYATVTYTAGATGGKVVSAYTATSSPGSITGSGSSPITVSGLTNGTAYTFTVTATNDNGVSQASTASNSVTPVIIGAIQPWSTGTIMPDPAGNNSQRNMTFTTLRNNTDSSFVVVWGGGYNTSTPSYNSMWQMNTNDTYTGSYSSAYNTSSWNTTKGNEWWGANCWELDGGYHLVGNRTLNYRHMRWNQGNQNGATIFADYPTTSYQLSGSPAATPNGFYMAGGLNTSNVTQTWFYKWTNNSWTTMTSLPAARRTLCGGGSNNGYVLMTGGFVDNTWTTVQTTTYLYSESGNSWSTVASIPAGTSYQYVPWVDTGSTGITTNRFYVTQGYVSGLGYTNATYSYSITANAWRSERAAVNSMPGTDVGWNRSTGTNGKTIYTAGGLDVGARNNYYAQII